MFGIPREVKFGRDFGGWVEEDAGILGFLKVFWSFWKRRKLLGMKMVWRDEVLD
jgi:hypothetical protein